MRSIDTLSEVRRILHRWHDLPATEARVRAVDHLNELTIVVRQEERRADAELRRQLRERSAKLVASHQL